MAYGETEKLAKLDSLTAAKTRRVFDEFLHAEWERFKRYKSPFCVALLDVDHLKDINDTHGHAAGDEVLCKIAEIAARNGRASDLFARYGGDEFSMLLPETTAEGVAVLINRIQTELRATRLSFADMAPSVSIGAACSIGKRSPEEVLVSADRALYDAKRAGRGRSLVRSGELIQAEHDSAKGEENGEPQDSGRR